MGYTELSPAEELLFYKLMTLPRLARLRFLYVWCERTSFLLTAWCPKELLRSRQQTVWDVEKLVDEFVFNPHAVDRASLERGKDTLRLMVDDVMMGCTKPVYLVVETGEALMRCAIGIDSDAFKECFGGLCTIVRTVCGPTGIALMYKNFNHELDLLVDGWKKHGWTDDSPSYEVLMLPGRWPLGKPEDWPNEGWAEAGAIAIGAVKKLGPEKILKILRGF